MNTSTLYVLARQWPYSGISLCSEDVYPDKDTAEATAKKFLEDEENFTITQKFPPILIMTLEDYISDYGLSRYDEGASNERESASWN